MNEQYINNSSNQENSQYAWYVVFVLTIIYTFSFIDRQIISLLVEPIKQDLKISDTQISLLQGFSFALFYTTLGIPIAALADKFNRRRIIAIGIFVWSLMTAACGIAIGFWSLFFARVGVGVGEASLSPAAHSIISDSFPKKLLGRALGIYGIGIVVGAGLAYIIGGTVVQWASGRDEIHIFNGFSIHAWQLTFIIVSLPAFILIPLLFTIKEPIRKNTHSKEEIKPFKELLLFLSSNKILITTYLLGFSLLALAAHSYFSWAPSFFIRQFSWSIGNTGLIFGSMLLVFGTLGTLSGGALMDFLFKKGYDTAPIRAGIVCAIGISISTFFSTQATNSNLALFLMGPAIFFLMFPAGIIPAGLHLIAPNHIRAQLSAVSLLAANLIGLSLGPTSVALITDYFFKDPQKVGISLAIVSSSAGVVATLLLILCMSFYKNKIQKIAQ